MPDVGVLQLKIAANIKSATDSLKTLQNRLDGLNQATSGFNLGNVASQIESIVRTVKGNAEISTAVKNLASLLNAISGFSKVKSIGFSEEQVQSIANLQDVANGFKVGQVGTQLNKLREALGGEWNVDNAENVRNALETIAGGTSALEKSGTQQKISDIGKALDGMAGVTAKNVTQAKDDIVDYQKAVDDMGDTIKEAQVTFKEPIRGASFLSKIMSGEYSTSRPTFENASVQSWRDTMNGIKEVNNELKNTDVSSVNNIGDLQRVLTNLGGIKGSGSLQKFADGINAIISATNNIGNSYLTLGRLSSALKRFGEVSQGFTVPSFARLESLARTLQENFNAENGLNRLAAGISAFKAATDGLDFSNVKSIASVIRSLNASAARSGKTASSLEAFSTDLQNASGANVSDGFAESASRIADVANETNEAYSSMRQLNAIIQQTGWSAQATAEQFEQMFAAWNTIRMGMSLNAGESSLFLGDGTGGSGAAWTYWKDGAIEVEGTVSDAMESIRIEAGETVPLLTGIVEENKKVGESFKSYSASDRMASRVEALRRIFANSSETIKKVIADIMHMEKSELFPETAATNAHNFVAEAQSASASARDLSDSLKRDYGTQMVEDLVNASSKTDLLKMRIDSLKESLAKKIDNNVVDGNQIAIATAQIQELQAEYNKLMEAANETKPLSARFSELMFGAEGLNGAFKRMFPTISGLLNRFKQLVKYRMLRAIIKQIAEGFREGTENYYKYSEAIGSGFAPAMDSAVSSLAQMKNSIGAAAAPVIQALIPYLQMAVNWFITAINYANQFFALLSGQTSWSRAVPQTAKAFDNVKKSAGGAGAAIKDLLADWDELNIIQSESGGGGGGGGASAMEDYLNMFEESSIFDERIKDLVNFIRENFDDILEVVKDIGLAILAWKFSNAFSGLLGDLARLITVGLIVKLSFDAAKVLDKAYTESNNIGFLIGDLALTGALAGIGGKLMAAKYGAAAGLITAGITFAVSAGATFTVRDSSDVLDEAKRKALTMLGMVKLGIASALLAAGFIAGGVNALLAIAGSVISVALITSITYTLEMNAIAAEKAKQMAMRTFAETGEGGIKASEYIDELQKELDYQTAGARLVINAYVDMPELQDSLNSAASEISAFNQIIFHGEGKLTEDDAEEFKKAWGIVIETLQSMDTVRYNTILAGLTEALNSKSTELRATVEEIRTSFIMLEQNVSAENAEIYKTMETLSSKIASGVATPEDIEEYSKYYKVYAAATETGFEEVEKAIKAGERIDFGDADTAVENAKDFIKQVGESIQAASDEVDQALSDTVESIEAKKRIETAKYEAGFITAKDYKERIDNYEQIIDAVTQYANERKGIIHDKMQNAYDMVFNQALSSPAADTDVYWEHVIVPLMQEAKEAGYTFPETLINAYTEGINRGRLDIGMVPDSFIRRIKEQGITSSGGIANALTETLNAEAHQQGGILDQIWNSIIGANETGLTSTQMQAKDLFGISGWDLLSNEWKRNYTNAFINAFGADQTREILTSLGVDEAGANNLIFGDLSDAFFEGYNGYFDNVLPELDLTQPVNIDIETENVTSDLNEKIDKELQNASGSGGGGYGGARDYYANMGTSVMQGINSMFASMQSVMPWMNGSADITIQETRDSGEEIGNTAEGTRQGTAEIVTGQNTMNGYMQQVALSTAGMVDNQGTANSYFSQMVSLLRVIASNGGGGGGVAPSVAGGLVDGALKAFNILKG